MYQHQRMAFKKLENLDLHLLIWLVRKGKRLQVNSSLFFDFELDLILIFSVGTIGTRLKEATMINKSLLCLGHVINALADREKVGKEKHIPFRDSKVSLSTSCS